MTGFSRCELFPSTAGRGTPSPSHLQELGDATVKKRERVESRPIDGQENRRMATHGYDPQDCETH